MPTSTPADRPDKTDQAEAVAWLRTLWTISISNADLEDFFAWSREKPAARAIYDDLSCRIHDAMMAQTPPAGDQAAPRGNFDHGA